MSRINNRFFLEGHVGTDPEFRYNSTTGELAVARMPLAVDASYKDRETGELVEDTDWIDITFLYKGLVQNVVQPYVKKGAHLLVEGSIKKRVWDSKTRFKEDGVTPLKDSRYEFVVTSIRMLDGKSGAETTAYEVPADAQDDLINFNDEVPAPGQN